MASPSNTEALATEQVHLLNSNLATKTELKVAIASLKVELLKWMFGAMIVRVGLFVARVELLVTWLGLAFHRFHSRHLISNVG